MTSSIKLSSNQTLRRISAFKNELINTDQPNKHSLHTTSIFRDQDCRPIWKLFSLN